MSKHQASATATRRGKWWVVDVAGLGITQGRSVSEARKMANDLAASMLDVPSESVEATFTIPGKLGHEAQEAREATLEAAQVQEEAARKSRKAVVEMKAQGLSGADIAAILDLSPQRVSQLAKRAPEDERKRNQVLFERA